MLSIYKTPDNCFSIEEAQLASYEELLEELDKIKQGNQPSLFVPDQHSTGFSLACLKIRKATKREIKQAINAHRNNRNKKS
jgi:hypothetical protein